MLWIGTGQNPGNNDDTSAATGNEKPAGQLSGRDGAGGPNDSPQVTPRDGDRATARSLGARVAWAAARWSQGANADLREVALAGLNCPPSPGESCD